MENNRIYLIIIWSAYTLLAQENGQFGNGYCIAWPCSVSHVQDLQWAQLNGQRGKIKQNNMKHYHPISFSVLLIWAIKNTSYIKEKNISYISSLRSYILHKDIWWKSEVTVVT